MRVIYVGSAFANVRFDSNTGTIDQSPDGFIIILSRRYCWIYDVNLNIYRFWTLCGLIIADVLGVTHFLTLPQQIC
jgi:hypothetical protein